MSKFGSLLNKGIKNTESPKWLKEKILSLGQNQSRSSGCNKFCYDGS